VENELQRKADKLLKIKQVAQVYKKALAIPENKDLEKILLLKEILVRAGENLELKELREEYDRTGFSFELPKKVEEMTEEEKDKFLTKVEQAFNKATLKIFDTALQLDREKRLSIKWPGEEEHFLQIGSQRYNYEFTKLLSAPRFETKEGERWPSSYFDTIKGEAQLKPREIDSKPFLNERMAELQELMQDKVMELEKHGHLTADVFDIITHRWLTKAKSPADKVLVTVNDFLNIRGLKPYKRSKDDDYRSGYTEAQRKQIARQIDLLENIYIIITEMDVYPKGKKKQKVRGIRGRSVDVGITEGQIDFSGDIKGDRWSIRPGDIFAYYFFEPYGRQTALLSIKAVEYDPYRQRWEKSLTRYLAWQWKADKGGKRAGGQEGFKVRTLLDAANEKIYKRMPSRTKERMEKALDTLQYDGVIDAWEYEEAREEVTGRRGWWKEWLEWKIIITAPKDIKEHYPRLKK